MLPGSELSEMKKHKILEVKTFVQIVEEIEQQSEAAGVDPRQVAAAIYERQLKRKWKTKKK